MSDAPAITFRTSGTWGSGIGTDLSANQVDVNFYNVQQAIVTLQGSMITPNNITSITTTGTNFSFNFANDTSIIVPYQVLMFSYRGNWAPFTVYNVLDTIIVANIGLFVVLVAHTSASAFNQNATDPTTGLPLYQMLLPMSSAGVTVLAGLSDVSITSVTNGQVLAYNSTTSTWDNTTVSASLMPYGSAAGDMLYESGGSAGGWVSLPGGNDADVMVYNGGSSAPSWQPSALKQPVLVATTSALPTCTYANGSSGVGATLSASANGVLTIDSHNVISGDTILVKNQASGFQNGIYVCTTPGASGSAFVLTRRSDFNTAANVLPGAYVAIIEGTTNAGALFLLNITSAPTVGTTSLPFIALGGTGAGSGGGITQLTGMVTAGPGNGSQSATIPNNTVTNSILATMSAGTIKANNTASAHIPLDLTGSATTAMLASFVGDAGSGGVKGLVPAPAAGDAAAGKYLNADGAWSTIPPGGGLTIVHKTANYNVNAGDNGTHFDNLSATSGITFALPTASAGFQYAFAVVASHGLTVSAQSTDSLAIGTVNKTSGGTWSSSDPFSYIEFEVHNGGQYIATNVVGDWS